MFRENGACAVKLHTIQKDLASVRRARRHRAVIGGGLLEVGVTDNEKPNNIRKQHNDVSITLILKSSSLIIE